MNYLKELIKEFGVSEENIQDKLMNVEYSNKISYNSIPNIEKIQELLLRFPKRDKVVIELSNVTDDIIRINNHDNIDKEAYKKFIKENSDIEYEITLYIKIHKNTNCKEISIYDFQSFWDTFLQKDITYGMKFFSKNLKTNNQINFVNYDNEYQLCTKTILMSSCENKVNINYYNRDEGLEKCKSCSKFWNMEEYELIPEDFDIQIANVPKNIEEFFGKIKSILSLIYIATVSRIENLNLYLQINGYTNKEYKINIETFEYKENYIEFYNIYNWSICEGNIVDKMELIRNVFSIHCKYSSILDIDKTTFESIKSNYKIYLRKNIDKYIELKNKAIEFMITASKTTNDIIMEFIDCLKKNIATFITFIIGTILANILSDTPLDNIFTNDIIAICCWILIGSFFYLIISIKELNFKKERYSKEYDSLKESYNDILDKDDINEIFNNDIKYNENINLINKMRNKYTFWWIVMILATGIALCVYKNYNFIYHMFELIIKIRK